MNQFSNDDLFVYNIAQRKELKENDAVGKNQRFGAKVAHRIKMTEKINLEIKERHTAEMAAYETRIEAFKSSYIQTATNQRKRKAINEKLDFFY